MDRSKETFEWGRPDLSLLRQLCWQKFGWTQVDTDRILDPVRLQGALSADWQQRQAAPGMAAGSRDGFRALRRAAADGTGPLCAA